jgi:hypothetical protein
MRHQCSNDDVTWHYNQASHERHLLFNHESDGGQQDKFARNGHLISYVTRCRRNSHGRHIIRSVCSLSYPAIFCGLGGGGPHNLAGLRILSKGNLW